MGPKVGEAALVPRRTRTGRRTSRFAVLALAIAVLSTAAVTARPAASAEPTASLTFPIRAAFYYAWYPENWVPGTKFTPTLGQYDSSSPTVIQRHIAAMQHAQIQAGISSWWGAGATSNNATQRFPLLLEAARGTGFRWAVYYEPEGYADPTAAQIESELRYIVETYASSPSYLRVGGRPVVFVYSGVGDGCGMAERWQAGNTVGAHVVLGNSWVDNAPPLGSGPPYGTSFTAGVRVAAGDLTGDGKAEIVTAPGAGQPPLVSGFSATGAHLGSGYAGDPNSRAGVFVAVGDVTGDGLGDIVTATGAGVPARVDVYAPTRAGTIAHHATFDPGIANGVRVAAGDVTGDGRADIIAASGPGAAPTLKVFQGDGTPVTTLTPYDASFTKGLYVAAADIAGDGRAEIVLGSANATRNEVRVLDLAGTSVVPPFEAYPQFAAAISVAAADVNGDGERDIVTGASGGPRVRTFTLRLGRPSGLASFFAYDPATTGQVSLAAADIAGDATADIITGSPAGQIGTVRAFGNVRDCASQPDGWHEYLVTASGESSFGAESFTVAPGYWWAQDPAPLLPRDPARWSTNVRRMVASGAKWQLALSFNEWGEGTSVESATQWSSASGFGTYLDTLRAIPTGTPTVGSASAPGANLAEAPTAPPAAFPLGHRR